MTTELLLTVNRPFGINKNGQFWKKTKSSGTRYPTEMRIVVRPHNNHHLLYRMKQRKNPRNSNWSCPNIASRFHRNLQDEGNHLPLIFSKVGWVISHLNMNYLVDNHKDTINNSTNLLYII